MSTTVAQPASEAGTGIGLFSHPKGLYILFFTEMWERFSYYGMRAILVYYMMKQLMFSGEKASNIYGLYTAFVYFTPFFGGMLADRILGQRKAVVLGGLLMAVGQFMLAVESLFYPGLFFLILGNGAFKPNISTQVGALYAQGDHRRDAAFSIFYMGINLGALFSPLVCGTLGEFYGWRYGFIAAGVGMLAGLAFYLWGQKFLAPDNIMKKSSAAEAKKEEPLTKEDWSRIIALIILCAFNIVFWAVYEQQGNVLARWADENTNRNIMGWTMPASWFQSINPFLIIFGIPFLIQFWAWQAKRGKEPSSVAKMAFGCILLGISFLIMIGGARAQADGQLASPLWLVGCISILTIGEVYLSPIGLSLVTKLAPARIVSMLMGVWLMSSFFGNYLAGFTGMFWDKMSKETYFLALAVVAAGAGLGMLAVIKPLKRAMSRRKAEQVDL